MTTLCLSLLGIVFLFYSISGIEEPTKKQKLTRKLSLVAFVAAIVTLFFKL